MSQSFFQGAQKVNCRCPKSWARADLDKDEGEVNGVQELGPGIAEDEQQGHAHRQKAEGEGHPARVVSGLPVQQPFLFDQALQLGVLISP